MSRQLPAAASLAAAAGLASGSVNTKVPQAGPCCTQASQHAASVAATVLTCSELEEFGHLCSKTKIVKSAGSEPKGGADTAERG